MSAPHYPHVIQGSVNERLGQQVLPVILLGLSGWMTFVILALEDAGFWTMTLLLAVFAVITAGSIWFSAKTWTERTIFDCTSVRVESVWGVRRFERASLHGWRWGSEYGALVSVELYRKGSAWVTKRPDSTVGAWFEGTENLTLTEMEASRAEIEADEALGATRDERLKTTDAETLFLRRAHWFGLALFFWVAIYPRPYALAVGTAIFLPVALVITTYLRRGRWRLWVTSTEFRASPTPLITLCVLATTLRAFYDWHIVDWFELGAIMLVAGILIAVVLLVVFGERFTNRDRVMGTVFAAVLFACGAIVPLNMWFDDRDPETLRGFILSVEPESVDIAPPPPLLRRFSMDISPEFSRQLDGREEICIDLYRGAFAIRSLEIRICEASDAPAEGANP